MSIRIEDLHHTYPGRIEAVQGVSLSIGAGELVAIMGENGAGKTTLVKHLNGLLKPTEGRVLVDGIDTRLIHVAKLSLKVGMVFQNPDHQIFAKNVYAEIAFGLTRFNLYKLQLKKRVGEIAETMGLRSFLDQSPFTLSLGERKRVAIASVLAWDPEIIVLDEPTIGQDALLKASLKRLILKLHETEKTIIIISHDVEFVAELGPRVVLMRGGKIIADGPAEKILTDTVAVSSASLTLPQIAEILYKFDGKSHQILDLHAAIGFFRSKAEGAS